MQPAGLHLTWVVPGWWGIPHLRPLTYWLWGASSSTPSSSPSSLPAVARRLKPTAGHGAARTSLQARSLCTHACGICWTYGKRQSCAATGQQAACMAQQS